MSFSNKATATRLDPSTKAFLDLANANEGPPLEEMSIAGARQALKELYLNAGEPKRRIHKVKNINIPGPNGEIPLHLYYPKQKFLRHSPVVLFFHGGGWALGDAESYENLCRFMALKTGAIFVSVEYRLSPENRFPVGLHDCYASLEWLVKNAGKIGGNTSQVAVMGDSAGANFAALCALRARDIDIKLSGQILLYPVLALDNGNEYPSMAEYGAGEYFISQASIAWTVDLYLENEADARSPKATPLLAKNLHLLAPALVIVGGFDPLRDECKAYADRLSASNVKTEFRCYPTTIHGFMSYSGALDVGRTGLNDTAKWICDNF